MTTRKAPREVPAFAEPVLRELLLQLHEGRAEDRGRKIATTSQLLGELGHPGAVPALLDLLANGAETWSQKSLRSLSSQRAGEAIAALTLCAPPEVAAQPVALALVDAAIDDDAFHRVLGTIRATAPPRMDEVLAAALPYLDEDRERWVLRSLQSYPGSPSARRAALTILGDGGSTDGDSRRNAIRLLAQPTDCEVLVKLIEDPDAKTAAAAAWQLTQEDAPFVEAMTVERRRAVADVAAARAATTDDLEDAKALRRLAVTFVDDRAPGIVGLIARTIDEHGDPVRWDDMADLPPSAQLDLCRALTSPSSTIATKVRALPVAVRERLIAAALPELSAAVLQRSAPAAHGARGSAGSSMPSPELDRALTFLGASELPMGLAALADASTCTDDELAAAALTCLPPQRGSAAPLARARARAEEDPRRYERSLFAARHACRNLMTQELIAQMPSWSDAQLLEAVDTEVIGSLPWLGADGWPAPLRSPTGADRAIEVLGDRGVDVVPTLMASLTSANGRTLQDRSQAERALERIIAQGAVAALRAIAADDELEIRLRARAASAKALERCNQRWSTGTVGAADAQLVRDWLGHDGWSAPAAHRGDHVDDAGSDGSPPTPLDIGIRPVGGTRRSSRRRWRAAADGAPTEGGRSSEQGGRTPGTQHPRKNDPKRRPPGFDLP